MQSTFVLQMIKLRKGGRYKTCRLFLRAIRESPLRSLAAFLLSFVLVLILGFILVLILGTILLLVLVTVLIIHDGYPPK